MLELWIKPRWAERRPFHMFFVGLVYSAVVLTLIGLVFANDGVLREYGGILVVTFTVIVCMPFFYYIIRLEEGKDIEISKSGRLLKEHSKAIHSLMWLFLGIVVGFSISYIVFPDLNSVNFNAQTKVFCAINSRGAYNQCLVENGLSPTGGVVHAGHIMSIFANNIGVLIFTLIFSLLFGAGAIFILVWNASVIAAAIGMFARESLARLPLALGRYMIHGIPEIAAYFVGALAGGIISVAMIRKDLQGKRRWHIMHDSLLLIIIAVGILFVAALIEVFITPRLFS